MVAIKMNYTNFTTDEPVLQKSSVSATFPVGRDIAYLVFSILQFLVTLLGLFWVNYIIKEKDRRDEKERLEKDRRDERERLEKDRRDEKERLEKEERDKIADIINNEYNKIVEESIDEKLRKFKEKYKAMVMFHGREGETRVTGLDVVRFMLHNPNDFQGEPLRKLQQDLAAVVKLFRSLRVKLPLKGDCPVNIKEELGPLITDVGEIARSFVSAKKRYTISNVLKYFGNGEEVRSIEDEVTKDDNDNKKTKRLLPYLNALSLGDKRLGELTSYHDRDFSFDIVQSLESPEQHRRIVSDLKSITFELCKNVTEAQDLRRFTDWIDAIWNRQNFQEDGRDIPKPDLGSEEHLSANIIHALRVFMYEVAEGNDVIQDEGFKELVGDMMRITKVQPSALQRRKCERAMQTIKRSLRDLEQGQSHLCGQEPMAEILERVDKALNDTINALRNQQA